MGLKQRLGEFEGDSGAAQKLASVAAIFAVGIEHGKRRRKASGCVRQMVVGDDEVDAKGCGRFGRSEGANAGIDTDDQACARGCCGFYALRSSCRSLRGGGGERESGRRCPKVRQSSRSLF